MSEIYFTIAGTNHWYGQEFIEPQMKVKLVKEDPWMEDVMQMLSEIKDPTMRKLAIDQLKCIARIS